MKVGRYSIQICDAYGRRRMAFHNLSIGPGDVAVSFRSKRIIVCGPACARIYAWAANRTQ